MKAFEYFETTAIEDAVAMLIKYEGKAKLLAGGTDLLVMMKEETISPRYIINIGRIADLSYISFDDEKCLKIGGLTTIRDIERSKKLLQSRYRVISEAASQLASISVRNVATIGGNLCNAAPSADMAPILIAMSAVVKLVGTAGERIVPLEEFFVGPGATVLKANELLAEIQIPSPPVYTAGIYLKHSLRRAEDLAIVGVAAVIILPSVDGKCVDAKIVLGAVAPTPMRAREAERILKGKKITEELILKAAKTASDESRPISDVRGSADYRREMVKVLSRNAIRRATDLAKSAD